MCARFFFFFLQILRKKIFLTRKLRRFENVCFKCYFPVYEFSEEFAKSILSVKKKNIEIP